MITFITHLRYDSDDRIKNLQTILNYYSKNLPDSKFIFIEDDATHNEVFDSIRWPKNTSFYFIKNTSYYYRTRALNYGISQAKTPVCVSLDADCIVTAESINEITQSLLADKNIGIAWPYTYVIDTPLYAHDDFIDSDFVYERLLKHVPDSIHRESTFNDFRVWTDIERPSVGGVVMFRTDVIKKVKGYNEKFIAWGYEDNELHYRITTLGYNEYRTPEKKAYCFHLRHADSVRDNSPFYAGNHTEVTKVTSMNKMEIEEYIKDWKIL